MIMPLDEDGAKQAGASKKYEARVRATLPILEIFEHARETLIRLERRTADVTPASKTDRPRPRTGRFERGR